MRLLSILLIFMSLNAFAFRSANSVHRESVKAGKAASADCIDMLNTLVEAMIEESSRSGQFSTTLSVAQCKTINNKDINRLLGNLNKKGYTTKLSGDLLTVRW